MDAAILCQCFLAPNDKNGNPRRLWLAYNKRGAIIKLRLEGHAGPPKWSGTTYNIQIVVDISASTYKRLIKLAEHYNIEIERG
jgi:hypothetical protein